MFNELHGQNVLCLKIRRQTSDLIDIDLVHVKDSHAKDTSVVTMMCKL